MRCRESLLNDIESIVNANDCTYSDAMNQILQLEVADFNASARNNDYNDETTESIDFINDIFMNVSGNPPKVHGARVYHVDCGKAHGTVYAPSIFGPKALFCPTIYECHNPGCGKVTFYIAEHTRDYYQAMNILGRAIQHV